LGDLSDFEDFGVTMIVTDIKGSPDRKSDAWAKTSSIPPNPLTFRQTTM
jgi:hypothetical protein